MNDAAHPRTEDFRSNNIQHYQKCQEIQAFHHFPGRSVTSVTVRKTVAEFGFHEFFYGNKEDYGRLFFF